MKQKILFAMLMALITTSTISFTLIAYTRGFVPGFVPVWIKSWLVSYLIAVPVIILVSPKVQAFVNRLFESKQIH